MRVAIVGCGYVADYYLATLGNHPRLELAGVCDRLPERARRVAARYGVRQYQSLDEVRDDRGVELVVNLTDPRSHFAVSSAALQAGKHVYSEKPLATDLAEAQELVALAEREGLLLAAAPCSVLGEAAQTVWRALRERRIGVPRLVYAELDDGPIADMDYASWVSASGSPWPAQHEFETGCTLEHAGYYLTWLTAFFGPARALTSSAHVVVPDKGLPVDTMAPDFTTASVEFASGTVARLTCSIFADHDRRMRIFGDAGVLAVADAWNYLSPVYLTPRTPDRHMSGAGKVARRLGVWPLRRRLPLVRRKRQRWGGGPARMDYSRGIAELAEAVAERRAPRVSARWSLHVTELVLAIQNPGGATSPRPIRSTFEPMSPMPWAAR